MKKILYILDQPNLYGSEIHVLKLIDMLKHNYDITLLCFNNGPLLERIPKEIHVKVFPMGWLSIGTFPHLISFIKNERFDYIHCHQPKAMLYGSMIGKLLGVKTFVTVHSLPENNRDSYRHVFKRFLVYAFHTTVLFLSELVSSKIIYLTQFSLKKSFFQHKAICIPNWIDVDTGVRIYNSSKTLKLVSIGSVSYQKGVDRLIEALYLVIDLPWELTIIGDGEKKYLSELRERIDLLGLTKRINFLGYKEDTESYLKESDYFVLLSRGETFGMVYLEAMSVGLSIVAWNIPAVLEVVPSYNLIINSISQLKNIFTKEYAKDYQQRADLNISYVKENFSTSSVLKSYLMIYG